MRHAFVAMVLGAGVCASLGCVDGDGAESLSVESVGEAHGALSSGVSIGITTIGTFKDDAQRCVREDSGAYYAGTTLLRFDLAGVSCPTLRSATLHLNGHTWSGSKGIRVHRVLRAWKPAEVSWTNAAKGTPWATPGARGVGTDIEQASVLIPLSDGSDHPLVANVKATVAAWLSGAPNNGFLVRSADGKEMHFWPITASNGTVRPWLELSCSGQ